MATVATLRPTSDRAPIPRNYFCKSCGLEAHHWIMDCSLLAVFHAANKILEQANMTHKEKEMSHELPDELVQINCSESHSVRECQSLHRIIMALRFYQSNRNNDERLLYYFDHYQHLLNDYSHILSVHLNQDKEINDMNGALIYSQIEQFVQCDLKTCPFFLRSNHQKYGLNTNVQVKFLKNTLDTIHCYFLHPFRESFNHDYEVNNNNGSKMIRTASFEEQKYDKNPIKSEEKITWKDEELMHLQNEINLRTKGGIKHNQYNKFIIAIKDKNLDTMTLLNDEDKNKKNNVPMPMSTYFGERYYFWDWYKENKSEDWRCNPGRLYKDLYIAPKYANIKEEICQNSTFRLSLNNFDMVYCKATNYLNSCQVIRGMKSRGNELCHYKLPDGQCLNLNHLISLILYTDYKQLCHYFVGTFCRLQPNENEKAFKQRKREYYFWTKLLRESVELFGTPISESKLSVFYVAVSNTIIFDSFSARFCRPTSTTSQLQIVSMCTNNGMILELRPTSEISYFHQGLLKFFNCSLLSLFGEEDERLFMGGWAPLQFSNIRVVIQRKENYFIFIRAIQHFECVLDGEEGDDFDFNENYAASSNNMSRANTSYLSRTNTSYESIVSESEYSVLSGIDHKIKMRYMKSQKIVIDEKCNDEDKKCKKLDGIIIKKLCKQMLDANVYQNEFPKYVNAMFQCIVLRRNHIFINLADLKTHYFPFCKVLASAECDSLLRFDILHKLFLNVSSIIVDMSEYAQLSTNYLLLFCDQMMKIEEKNENLEKIVLLKVKKECITLKVWDEVYRKYNNKFSNKLWFKCIAMFRHNFEKNLSVFFNERDYKNHIRNQRETNSPSSSNNERLITFDDDTLDATKSYAL